jgi:ABC-type branched-subunit amino acid transport system ATPase component
MWRRNGLIDVESDSSGRSPGNGFRLGVSEPVLSLHDVTVRFGGVSALTDISVEIAPSTVMAIVGPNGAGKTTLLNAICGLIRKNTVGDIQVNGRPVLGRSPAVVARAGVGRSFQNPPLIDQASVMENVLGGAHLSLGYKMGDQIWRRRHVRECEDVARRKALEVLDFVGLVGQVEHSVSGLPYGTRKLVDIARAMMCGGSLLLLDEPTSGLDSGEQQLVRNVLEQIRNERKLTVLMVEHHMELVRVAADQVLGLQAGSVLATGSPSEVLDSERFRSAIVGTTMSPGQVVNGSESSD